jgi:O-antigen/teichoic acid export membrane protein
VDDAARGPHAPAPDQHLSASTRSYGRGAAVLSAGIGVTGLVTYLYFSLASHALSESEYGGITLLWSAIFVVVSVLYRPVEQLLSRTIADREARGLQGGGHLRVAATIQLSLGVLFVVLALLLRSTIEDDLFGGSETLYWVLIVAVLAYAASYFARGYLAGHHRFGLYGGLVLLESVSRCMFAVLAVAGVTSSQSFVALGMAAAPLVSLVVVPWAVTRRARPEPVVDEEEARRATARADEAAEAGGPPEQAEFTLSNGVGFAAAVLLIMLAEQTFLNAGPLLVKATADSGGTALAGFAFNALLIARAPLQLFQAVQTSILPHLTKMSASGETDPFRRSVNLTLTAIAVFSGAVSLGLLAVGPYAMDLLFGGDHHYGRGGLVMIGVGMGFYLAAATLNQAALARGRTKETAACWIGAAAAFVVMLVIPGFDDKVLQVEIAYLAGALLLSGLLYGLYRRG